MRSAARASTETPFGPDFKITTLSYVMSLMPPQVLEDLQLAKHGYEVHPMGPGYIPFPDGRSLTHYDDVASEPGGVREVLQGRRGSVAAVGSVDGGRRRRCSVRC